MAEFRVERTPDPTFPAGSGHEVVRLEGPECRCEVWPGRGFNPLRWQVRAPGLSGWHDLLYVAPDWDSNPVPTRSGQPVLFPFPNRLKFGRFDFRGATYQLPLTESTKTHAIHGFAPRTPWRVVGADSGADSASATGELSLSRDLPESVPHWPADFTLRVTYTLRPSGLEVLAELHNPGEVPLPFGLGYHPYFRWPHPDAGSIDELVLEADTARLWTAVDSLATGESVPVTPVLDWRTPRPVGSVVLDHLYRRGGAGPLAVLTHSRLPGRLTVSADSAFRELLVFTPPHRHALAIEPYTCATDAANLGARGIDAGWRELAPGGEFRATVGYGWSREGVALLPNAD